MKVVIPEPREEVVLFPGKFCQNCKMDRPTTRNRSIYTKSYTGPCGDSFCYASCDSPSCRAVSLTICDDCAKALAKPGTSGAPLR